MVPTLSYEGVEERKEMVDEIFSKIFEFEEIVVVKDQNKEAIIEAFTQLRAKAEEFSKTVKKDEKMAIAIVNIGY